MVLRELRRVISWDEYNELVSSIASQIGQNEPEAIVGLTRGGLVPAVQLSHMYNAKLYCLNISLRDGKCSSESFDWRRLEKYNRILVVDDINDTGATFDWIKQDWESGCLPDSIGWEDVWHENVRFATMCEKTHTNFGNVDYVWEEIDTSEKDTWIVFPWEYD